MLKIKDRVCLISLREEVLSLFQFDNSSAKPGMREKGSRVKCGAAHIGHHHGSSFEAVWTAVLGSKARKSMLQRV